MLLCVISGIVISSNYLHVYIEWDEINKTKYAIKQEKSVLPRTIENIEKRIEITWIKEMLTVQIIYQLYKMINQCEIK